MPLDLKSWQTTVKQRLQDWQSRWKCLRNRGTATLYPFLAATALLPVAEAVHGGDWGALAVLGGVVASVGSNLIANVIQDWKDEADGAQKLAAAVENDAALRAELDAVLEKLDVVVQAQVALSETDRAWFTEMLHTELSRLGNLARYEAALTGGGTLIQGNHNVGIGERGVNIGEGVGGDVITGDNARRVQAQTYIENQHVVSKPDTATPLALRAAYLNHLFETAGQLALSGVDPKAASEAEARLNLGAVYTALLTLTPEECDHLQKGAPMDLAEATRHQSCEARRLSAVEQLDHHPKLVLLGDPGSGKSTFVNFVALCLTGELLRKGDNKTGESGAMSGLALLTAPLPPEEDEERRSEKTAPQPQPWTHGSLLPVCVTLRDFAARGLPPAGERATAKHLWDFIAAELATAALGDYAPHLSQELRQRGGLLLLDGLDEVPEAEQRREQLKQAVEDFAKTFNKCRVLVTSRTYAYQQQAWRLADFAEAVLAPFSSGQIARFAERWYAHIAPMRGLHEDDATGRAELLKRAIFASDRLRGLAERPLLLTLMASLHAWRGGSLPEKREELYADTVDLLLDWWERPKVVRNRDQIIIQQPSLAEWLRVDRAQVRALLEQLAFTAHAGQPAPVGTADVPEGALLSDLLRLSQNPDVKPARLVEYLSQRAGLLLPRGVGVYTFPHRTFQEYLAACYLTDHEYPEKVAELARNDSNRWREVALLAGAKAARGTASAVWSLVDALCYRDFPIDSLCNNVGQAGSLPLPSPTDSWGALLAGQALVENAAPDAVSARNLPKLNRVKTHLIGLMQAGQLPAVERALAGDVLAALGDPRFHSPSPIHKEKMGDGGAVDAMQFCYVPPGPFWMGSEEYSSEKPLHLNDCLTGVYWIARYPVTVVQFREFITATGHAHHAASLQGVDTHPVVVVNWYEARAFCDWLAARWRGYGWLAANQLVRLPTEAEWEKAARGGLELPPAPTIVVAREIGNQSLTLPNPKSKIQNPKSKRRFPWGDDLDPEWANYGATGLGTTSAVGAFPGGRTPYGVEEMSGNVWEWTQSAYEPYPYVLTDGREDVEKRNARRVMRGGAFYDFGDFVRCADRLHRNPDSHIGRLGFRIVVGSPFSHTLDADISDR